MAKETILNKSSLTFLEKYLNNAAPTGYEWESQKIWMEYLKPYVDTFITDTYGSAVGVINPDAKLRIIAYANGWPVHDFRRMRWVNRFIGPVISRFAGLFAFIKPRLR